MAPGCVMHFGLEACAAAEACDVGGEGGVRDVGVVLVKKPLPDLLPCELGFRGEPGADQGSCRSENGCRWPLPAGRQVVPGPWLGGEVGQGMFERADGAAGYGREPPEAYCPGAVLRAAEDRAQVAGPQVVGLG